MMNLNSNKNHNSFLNLKIKTKQWKLKKINNKTKILLTNIKFKGRCIIRPTPNLRNLPAYRKCTMCMESSFQNLRDSKIVLEAK